MNILHPRRARARTAVRHAKERKTPVADKMAVNKDLVEAVRHYVHFDNLAEALNKQVANARTMRGQYETKILTNLEATGMKNAVLQINGATLQRASRSQANPLSWGFLEEQLHAYYAANPSRGDETTTILNFLQNRRGSKTTDYLKKTVVGADSGSKKPPT
jgi:hypothetical protein